jgi:nitroimidazol reductase NimA-like FMN-containing flavoprotein (pyridoxamine 5'-phosphate oxidase superfamily)
MSVTDEWIDGHLQELSEPECLELLRSKRVGRVAYGDDQGIAVVPVNYVVHQGSIWFRTSPHTTVGQHVRARTVAFEVDDIDEGSRAGWSVLVRGSGALREPEDLPEPSAERPVPWPKGTRWMYVSIAPRSISGRRLMPAS